MHIVVVGAGILGASTGYHAAQRGAAVTIVDQARDGRATAAGAGIICPWVSGADDPAFYRLYTEGARYYEELVSALAELGAANVGFRRVGALVVSNDVAELSAFDRMLSRRRVDTPEMGVTTLLAARDARALFSPLHPDLAALHVAGGARVDGRRMAAGLLHAAQRHGAVLRHAHAELVASGGRVTGIRVMKVSRRTASWSPRVYGRLRYCGLSACRCPSSRSVARSCICNCPDRIPATGRSSCHRAATTCWRSTMRALLRARRVRPVLGSTIASPHRLRRKCWQRHSMSHQAWRPRRLLKPESVFAR